MKKESDKKKKSSSLLKSTRLAPTRKDTDIKDDEKKGKEFMDVQMVLLGEQLVAAALSHPPDKKRIKNLLETDAPINYQDPNSGFAAIHYVAYYGDEEAIDLLLSPEWKEPCNLLLRTNDGFLPSACAARGNGMGDTMILARRLMKIEKEQGAKNGIMPLFHRDEPIDNGSIDDGP